MSIDQKLIKQATTLASVTGEDFRVVYNRLKELEANGGGADRRQPAGTVKTEPVGPVEFKSTPYYQECLARQRSQGITYAKAALQVRREMPKLWRDMLRAVNQ